jgi:hypothetical protein
MNDFALETLTRVLIKYGEHVTDVRRAGSTMKSGTTYQIMVGPTRKIVIYTNGTANYFNYTGDYDRAAPWRQIMYTRQDGSIALNFGNVIDEWPVAEVRNE